MRIAKFTNDQKERIKQWNEQNPHHIFSLKYCHINVPALNETVFKEQPIPAPTPYQLAQARRDQMAGVRRSQSKRGDEDFSISVPFKPIIDAMGEEIQKQLRAVLPGIIKPLLKDLVSCSTAADGLQERVFSHPPLYDLIQVKQPAVTTPMHRGAAAAGGRLAAGALQHQPDDLPARAGMGSNFLSLEPSFFSPIPCTDLCVHPKMARLRLFFYRLVPWRDSNPRQSCSQLGPLKY